MTKIRILDGHDVPNPEDRAMIQAMYSRSPAPVEDHLARVAEVGSGKFMGQYYVGYGHNSIGDLGECSIFLEGISMAAAKAVQAFPLYRGQECSTRYIDFTNQPITYNVGNDSATQRADVDEFKKAADEVMETWRSIYIKALPLVRQYVMQLYTFDYLLPEAVREKGPEKWAEQGMKTINAITFDICRGLLPIGCTTSVAWSGDLRALADHLRYMMTFNVPEIQNLALELYQALDEKYPNSFKELDKVAIEYARDVHTPYYRGSRGPTFTPRIKMDVDPDAWQLLKMRVREDFDKANVPFLPKELQFAATFLIEDKIDFASYRDLQRHRPGFMSLSLPRDNSTLPWNGWYMTHLKNAGKYGLEMPIQAAWLKTVRLIENYPQYMDEGCAQYFYPMMVEVPVKMNWSLGQCIYVNNLRSGVTVHPTLRAAVKQWAEVQQHLLGRNDVFRLDKRLDYQATWRGDQDIVAKPIEGTT